MTDYEKLRDAWQAGNSAPAGTQNPYVLPTPEKKWYYTVWFVLFLLACVGPFGLPLLFKSSEFSRTAKIIITLLLIVITVYLSTATVHIVQEVLKRYSEMIGS